MKKMEKMEKCDPGKLNCFYGKISQNLKGL